MARDIRRFDRWRLTECLLAVAILAGCGGHGTDAPATHRRGSLRGDGVYGVLYPAAHPRGPAVITIGGSEGRLRTTPIAKALAARGYPALALAYFNEPGLPKTLAGIRLEYFVQAARRLAKQPGVDPDRIILVGGSRGGEAALVTAAEFPRVFHGAIGLAPSSYLYPGYPPSGAAWTLRGQTLPAGMDIPVEKIRGPVLVAGAGKDGVWDSGPAVRYVAQTLHDGHFRYPHRELYLPNANHSISNALNPQVWPAVLRYLKQA
jgi:dienelactone hydrolase